MLKKIDLVSVWLLAIIGMIVIMVCLGGITRLTGSGLSITEWKPMMGVLPPLTEMEWEAAFLKYKMIPQFQVINSHMVLSDFKFIFFWEYFHRLVGRFLALVAFIPGIIFVIKKRLDQKMIKKVLIGFLVGLSQGFLGWFMVKSGLSELTYVSHLRLTAHLLLALIILSYWTYVYLEWKNRNPFVGPMKVSPHFTWVHLVAFLLFIQLSYGALVAGLKAGLIYNTFPTMNGEWVPSQLLYLDPKWTNFFNNGSTVQFLHRWIAVLLLIATFFSYKKITFLKDSAYFSAMLFISALSVQFLLGVITLVYHVPTVIAALHQLNACALVISISMWLYHLREN